MSESVKQTCPCGRSPLPKCVGLHTLTEQQFKEWLTSQVNSTSTDKQE